MWEMTSLQLPVLHSCKHVIRVTYLDGHTCCALQRHPPNAGVWEQAFAATDQGLECDDGCTATAALAWLDEAGALNLQTANVGDSSGIWVTPQHVGPPQVPSIE